MAPIRNGLQFRQALWVEQPWGERWWVVFDAIKFVWSMLIRVSSLSIVLSRFCLPLFSFRVRRYLVAFWVSEFISFSNFFFSSGRTYRPLQIVRKGILTNSSSAFNSFWFSHYRLAIQTGPLGDATLGRAMTSCLWCNQILCGPSLLWLVLCLSCCHDSVCLRFLSLFDTYWHFEFQGSFSFWCFSSGRKYRTLHN